MTCTQCGGTMLSGSDGFGKAYYCPGCGNSMTGKACMPNMPELKAKISHMADRMRFDMPDPAPKLAVVDGGKRQEAERELAGVGAHMSNPVNGFFAEDS